MTEQMPTPPPVETTPPPSVEPAPIGGGVNAWPPKPKKISKFVIALLIVVGVPLLFMVYRYFVNVRYTPSNIIKAEGSKVEKQFESKKSEMNMTLDTVDASLVKAAPSIPADKALTTKHTYNTTKNTYEDLPEQAALKGEISKIGDRRVQHVCQAVYRYTGNKFDSRPVGERMYCSYGVQQLYGWTGSKEKLEELVNQSQSNPNIISEDDYSQTTDLSRAKLTFQIVDASDYYESLNLIVTPAEWQRIFDDTNYKPVTRSDLTDPGTIKTLIVTNQVDYHEYFDRSL